MYNTVTDNIIPYNILWKYWVLFNRFALVQYLFFLQKDFWSVWFCNITIWKHYIILFLFFKRYKFNLVFFSSKINSCNGIETEEWIWSIKRKKYLTTKGLRYWGLKLCKKNLQIIKFNILICNLEMLCSVPLGYVSIFHYNR